MNKLFTLLIAFVFITSCNNDDSDSIECTQKWVVTDYCEATQGCNVSCEPTTNTVTAKCSDNIKVGDVKLLRQDGCVKYYRKFIKSE